MDSSNKRRGEPSQANEDPAAVYAHRLHALNAIQSLERRRERLLGYSKLVLAAITLISVVLFLRQPKILELMFVPVAGFALLAILQEKLIRSIRLRDRAINFYERGLARIEDRWAGGGEFGVRFLDPEHAYARDLDLFGRGSMFELLCTTRTRSGEETLAAWLQAAAPVDEVLQRQEAVRDLRPRVDFRENLFSRGETVRVGVHPDALTVWGDREPILNHRSTKIVTRALALIWLSSLAVWAIWGFGFAAATVTILNLAWAHRIHQRLDEACGFLDKAVDDLELLAEVLRLLEAENFSAKKLVDLQSTLGVNSLPSSKAIKKLARLAEYIRSRHSLFLRPLDLVLFWSAQLVFAAERWQQQYGPSIRGWLKAVGELEALTAIAAYSYEHPADVFPQFEQSGAVFEAEQLGHPLLPASKVVRNDVKLGRELQLLILSGPNMAGKSTFIRSIGLNAVLAQCGAPVRAGRLVISPLHIAASICILDSLSGGVSRFYAEIHRIKLIFDLSAGAVPVLFLLDELLSGTNSHDRLVGSEYIVRGLMKRNAIGIVSTHDLALTRIPEELGASAENCHFTDRFEDGRLIFDYMLMPGVVKTSNALQLMRSIGLGIDDEAFIRASGLGDGAVSP